MIIMRKLKTNYKNGEKFYAEDMNLVTSTINEIEDVVVETSIPISITYDELLALKENSQLEPGKTYRLTDFITSVVGDGRSVQIYQIENNLPVQKFDILIPCDGTDILNENVTFTYHEGDTYFSTMNLPAWKGKYKLGTNQRNLLYKTDIDSFPDEPDYADYYSYDGVFEYDGDIYYKWKKFSNGEDSGWWILTDTIDFSNVSTSNPYTPVGEIYQDDITFGEDNYHLPDVIVESLQGIDDNYKGEILYLEDENNNSAFYDFKNIQFKRVAITGIESTGVTSDLIDSLTEAFVYGSGNSICYGIQNGESHIPSDVSYTAGHDSHDIAIHFIFDDTITEWRYTFGASCKGNKIGYNNSPNNIVFGNSCESNSFGDYCHHNTIGNIFQNNTIGNGFTYNSIGNEFTYNSIGNVFQNNTIGNNVYYNSIGNGVYNNSIGNSFWQNSIGNNVYRNTIGNEVYNNSIGNSFWQNSIGNYFTENSIGNYFRWNTIGNEFTYNSIGNGFGANTIGNGFGANTIGNDFQKNTVNEGVNNIDFVTNYSSDTIQYLTILNGYGYGSLTAVPTGIAANASYPQMIGFNTSGNFVVKNVLD